jgi:hypothetical protein
MQAGKDPHKQIPFSYLLTCFPTPKISSYQWQSFMMLSALVALFLYNLALLLVGLFWGHKQ